MGRRGPATGRTSTYGQACMQCFKAKCRCLPRPSGDGCERCFRLGKECQPSDAARRRNAQKSTAPDARIAQLEGKIEALFSAMQSVVSSSGSPADVLELLMQESMSNSTAGAKSTPSNSSGPSPDRGDGPTPASGEIAMPNLIHGFSPTEAEESLDFFRSKMLPCFPFLTLAPTLTASQLRNDRPVLFEAILTITTFSTQRRLPRIEALKQLVFTSALINTKSNVDLLLGVLTYIAWSNDAFLGRADLLSRLMVLAISLVYDLRLFKPSRPDMQAIVAYTQGFPEDDQSTGDFMEQQRALLACFVLSSHISSHFGRIDPLRWTPQMDDALRVMATNKTCPTDETLAVQVRLQLLTHRAAQLREQHESDSDRSRTLTGTAAAAAASSVPSLLYLNALRAELQALKVSHNLDANHALAWPGDLLATHACYTEIYLDQTALLLISSTEPTTNTLSARGTSIDGVHVVPSLERLTSFWRSTEGIASWLAIFRRMPPAQCVGLPSHFWTQSIWCNAILKHLSTYPDPALDCRAVRGRVDLLTTLDWMVGKLELISDEAGRGSSDDLFRLLAKLFGRARVWAEARWNLPSQGQHAHGAAHCATGFENSMPDVEDMSWMDSMDLENDKWLEDVLGWSPAET
ncbi:hypothetical protein VTI74DRAFT_582 [Chaetomium olivicolor]